MLFNLVAIICLAILFWGLGRLIVKVLLKDDRFTGLYMIVGSSVVAVITSLLYFRMMVPMYAVSIFWMVIMIAVVLIQLKHITKDEIAIYLQQIFIFILFLLPGLIHGIQYYVYRGNYWDNGTYLYEAITAYKYSWKELISNNEIWTNDIYKAGYRYLVEDRPPISLVLSMLLFGGKGDIYFMTFLYHGLFYSMIYAPMYSLTNRIVKGRVKWLSPVIVLTYILGFWGQIQYDINAWSHLASIGIYISNIYLFMMLFESALKGKEDNLDNRIDMKIAIALNIVMLGGSFYYVENWMVQYAIACITVLALCILNKYRASIKQVLAVLSLPVTAFLVSLVACPQVAKFLIKQFNYSVVGTVEYGNYWTDWMYGFWTVNVMPWFVKIPSFIVSACGMPIYVPWWGHGAAISLIWVVALMILLATFAVNICYRIYRAIVKRDTDISEQFLVVWVLVCLLLGTVISLKTRDYIFVKYVIYVSPYIWILLTTSVATVKDKSLFSIAIGFSVCMCLISGILFLGLRTYDTATNVNANGYRRCYPSDQNPELKETHLFNLDITQINDATVVQIEDENPFYLDYLKLSILYSGREYYCEENHVQHDIDYLEMIKPDKIDAKIVLEMNDDGKIEPCCYYIE